MVSLSSASFELAEYSIMSARRERTQSAVALLRQGQRQVSQQVADDTTDRGAGAGGEGQAAQSTRLGSRAGAAVDPADSGADLAATAEQRLAALVAGGGGPGGRVLRRP